MIKHEFIRYRHPTNLSNNWYVDDCECTIDQHKEKRIGIHYEFNCNPADALRSLLFNALDGCSGLVEEHSFPTRMVVATGGSDIDVYEGPPEEMEPLFRAAVLDFLFSYPVEQWCEPGYGYNLYFELFQRMDVKAETITSRMLTHYKEHGYVPGDVIFGVNQKVPAKFIYMLIRGVTSEEQLFAGVKIKKEDDFLGAVELHLELGTPIQEIIQGMNLAAA